MAPKGFAQIPYRLGFSLDRFDMGDLSIWGGGQVQGDKALMGRLMRGDLTLIS